MKKKNNQSYRNSGPKPGKYKKAEKTRRKIIAAARRVFTSHPYNAASIRMIGAEGGFDYSIIHHYFTKTELFQAVAEQLYGELTTAFIEWLDGLLSLPPEERLKQFLDRSLDYLFENPDVLALVIQNMGYMNTAEDLPGFEFFIKFYRDIESAFLERNNLTFLRDKVSRWSYTLLTLYISYVGAAGYHNKALGMAPNSDDYRNWIKTTILHLFVPPMENLIEEALRETGPTSEPK